MLISRNNNIPNTKIESRIYYSGISYQGGFFKIGLVRAIEE